MHQLLKTRICSAVALFIWLPCSAQTPAATLEIQVPKSEFRAGSAIRLDVNIRNSSTEDLRIWKTSPTTDGLAEAYLSIKVRDTDGKYLPRVDGATIMKSGKKYVIEERWLTRKGVTVLPNQNLHDFLILSTLFDLSRPGTYSVSAEADIPKPNSGPEIKWIVAHSNEVTFTVKQVGSP